MPRGPSPGEIATETTISASADNDTGCNPSSYQPQKCTILPGGDPVLPVWTK